MPITLNGTTGITTPGLINTGSTTFVDLTTTGNTILGDQSTDTLNVANGNLVLNSSGNLGIGTASPAARLHVVVDGAGESDIARFSRTNGADTHFLDIGVNADTNFVIFDSSGSAAGGYTFRRGGTDAMTLSAGGVLTVTENAVIQGLTVGRGAGAVASNTAVGASALAATATGSNVVAVGYQAGTAVTSADNSTFVGAQAGLGSTTCTGVVAVGSAALYANTSGSYNTAIGQQALRFNTTASYNTAVGYQSLYSNTTGTENTAIGRVAGYTNSTGSYNAFLGHDSGYSATGSYNTFVGHLAGYSITTGAKNTILGRYNGNQNGLDIRTASNYIVLSDGDGVPRYNIDNKGNLQNSTSVSNSLFRQVSRSGGNATETFTSTNMGMNDNVSALINVSIGGTSTFEAFGGALIYWYMPRGGSSVIHQTIVPAFKGSAVTTFSLSVSGNSLVVTKDTALAVSITVIGGGGTSSI
jgi:hypothetical protein